MAIYKAVVTLSVLACASEAIAQTSNCINMGGNMVHCDTMGPNGSMSSSDCMTMGGGMVQCNTMDMNQPQRGSQALDMSRPRTDGTTSSFVADLIARSRERSLQKQVGQMLASGDCQGAANLAFTKGRVAMGNEIRRSCAPKPVADSPTIELEDKLRLAAAKANAATPMALDATTTVTKVEAIGSQVLLTATVKAEGMTVSDAFRAKVQNELCANQSSPALLTAGASIRIKYFEPGGSEIGSVMVTRRECGL